MNTKALLAEFIGTFALIFVGVGAIAADFLAGGKSGLAGIAFAHGLTMRRHGECNRCNQRRASQSRSDDWSFRREEN